MSIHIPRSATMRGMALSSLLAPMAMAASTSTWFYGQSDNSTTFGVTPDSTQSITWMDAWAGGNDPNGNYFGNGSIQVNRPDRLGRNQAVMMFGFDGTGLSSSQVQSATLYIRQSFSSPNGAPNTWNIVGIAAGNDNWDTNTMTWNDLDGVGSGDWTGGTLGASLAGNYGSFQDLGQNSEGNVVIDLTSAFQAYLDGTISGIAFSNATNGTTFIASSFALNSYSNDNITATNRPGLLVTIPEPGSALLALLGLGLLTRRRR